MKGGITPICLAKTIKFGLHCSFPNEQPNISCYLNAYVGFLCIMSKKTSSNCPAQCSFPTTQSSLRSAKNFAKTYH